MKQILRLLLFTLLILLAFGAYQYRSLFIKQRAITHTGTFNTVPETTVLKLRKQATQLRLFAAKKHYNSSVCFLVDMSLPCGRNRFYVYDLKHDTIKYAGLVAHGSGAKKFAAKPQFSNAINSGCTSLGKYEVSYKYAGQFGDAFKLNGLNSTNSNAFSRNVVLHAYGCVPDNETYPLPICNSLGCTMVSYRFIAKLKEEIKASRRPIVMWVYK